MKGHSRPIRFLIIGMLLSAICPFCVVAQDRIVRDSVAVSGHEKSTVPLYMAAKTNMLYDLAAVPNISAEFYVGHNISVGAQWMHAWWSCHRRLRYWRIYGGTVSARYWFGPAAAIKPLTGHHAGVYIGAETYDFQWGGTAYMGGKPGGNLLDRCMINAGVEYGYSLPVSQRLNIDFSIGVGYFGGIVEKFAPEEGYLVWQSTSRRTWIGPTKAEISLVWLIGPKNKNERKGGAK